MEVYQGVQQAHDHDVDVASTLDARSAIAALGAALTPNNVTPIVFDESLRSLHIISGEWVVDAQRGITGSSPRRTDAVLLCRTPFAPNYGISGTIEPVGRGNIVDAGVVVFASADWHKEPDWVAITVRDNGRNRTVAVAARSGQTSVQTSINCALGHIRLQSQ